MKGALYWQKVGALEIGSYIDSQGRKRLVARGETSIDMLDAVLLAARSVTACIKGHERHPTEAADTGRLLT